MLLGPKYPDELLSIVGLLTDPQQWIYRAPSTVLNIVLSKEHMSIKLWRRFFTVAHSNNPKP